MVLRKEAFFKELNTSFLTEYVKSRYDITDSNIEIYDGYKISIVLSNGLAAVTNKSVIEVGKNNILFFRPDEIHFGRFFKVGVYEYINFIIPTDFFEKMFSDNSVADFLEDRAEDRVNYIVFEMENQKTISDISQEIIWVLKDSASFSDVRLLSLMLRTISLCADNYTAQKNNPIKNKAPKYVTDTMSYVSENFEEKISLAKLAENVGCSVAYLSRVFKQYTGTTVYNYITDTRIANAQKLLAQGFSVSETGFLSGFDDCSNFVKTFKKLKGKTPLEYKKQFETA